MPSSIPELIPNANTNNSTTPEFIPSANTNSSLNHGNTPDPASSYDPSHILSPASAVSSQSTDLQLLKDLAAQADLLDCDFAEVSQLYTAFSSLQQPRLAPVESATLADLPGLRQTSDASGLPTWQLLPPSSPNLTADDRTNYLYHQLIPELAQTTVQFLAELTPRRAREMAHPEVLRAFLPLAEVLIALDQQNEDESLPFAQRPNPAISLFGDACRDVILKRIRDATRKLAV